MSVIEIRVPDIGDFKDVPIIEVHVTPGSEIKVEDPLITLESDKATMDVPAPASGVVSEIKVKTGDRVSEGSLILTLQMSAVEKAGTAASSASSPVASAAKPAVPGKADLHAEVLVLGAGPGGYTAAFRAADLGKKVVLVERWPTLGGVCLNVGCIPSKALLHAAKVIDEASDMGGHGISFVSPKVRLTGGLTGLAKARKVTVVQGTGKFVSAHQVEVAGSGGAKLVSFDEAIIAAGSEPVTLPFIPHQDKRVIDSTGALELDGIPERLLVIGGGIIGLEMATVYHSLGSKVTVVELMDQIIPGADKDIVTPLMKRIEKRYEKIYLGTARARQGHEG